jgi:hypothetical protein
VALDGALQGGVELPALSIGLRARDGRPLQRQPERLEVVLLAAEPDAAAAAAAGQQQHEEGEPEWRVLSDFTLRVPPARHFGGGPGGDRGAGDASGGAAAGPPAVYELAAGRLRVPPQPGLYKWLLRYPSDSPGARRRAWAGG